MGSFIFYEVENNQFVLNILYFIYRNYTNRGIYRISDEDQIHQ